MNLACFQGISEGCMPALAGTCIQSLRHAQQKFAHEHLNLAEEIVLCIDICSKGSHPDTVHHEVKHIRTLICPLSLASL